MSHAKEVEDMYPDPRKVLRGNGHVANLRCAVKYTAWQGAYALFAVLGAVLWAGTWIFNGILAPFGRVAYDYALEPVGSRVARVLRRHRVGERLADALVRFKDWLIRKAHNTKFRAITTGRFIGALAVSFGEWLVESRVSILGLILAAPFAFVLLVCDEIDQRTGLFTGVFNVIVFCLGSTADFAVGTGKQMGMCSKEGAKRFSRGVKEKTEEMQQKPGTRRIYGVCPVTFDQKPRWFENVFGEDDSVSAAGSEDNPWSEEDIEEFMDDVADSDDTLVTDGGRPYVTLGNGWSVDPIDSNSSWDTGTSNTRY